MRTREILGLAARDFYGNSWRLVPVNAAVGVVLVGATALAAYSRAGLLAVVLAGPLVAALVHSSVTLVRTGNVTLGDATAGLRRHWRRGFVLGAIGAALVLLGTTAMSFYGRSPFLFPLAFLSLYVLLLLGVGTLVCWTLAIAEPARPLRASAAQAAMLMLRRPGPSLLLGLALLVVNAAGIAAALMPFLTLTIAYSFLAAAHFALAEEGAEAAS